MTIDTDKVVFVFYTFKNGDKWVYSKLPKGWWWVGAGRTSPIGKLGCEYEEQFMGPKKTQEKVIKYLDKVFKNLKEKGVIKKYKIRKSYSP